MRNGPFSAAIDVVPRRSIRWQRPMAVNRADGVTRAIVAPSPAASSPGRARSSTPAPTWTRSPPPRRFQFVELGETGAATAGGSRASAHVLFRALREAAELRRFATPVASGGAGEARAHDPVVRDPNESRMTDPARGAARMCC